MPNPKITISSLEETIEREMTDDEFAELKKSQSDAASIKKFIDEQNAQKQLRKKALAEKLGISEQELNDVFA